MQVHVVLVFFMPRFHETSMFYDGLYKTWPSINESPVNNPLQGWHQKLK